MQRAFDVIAVAAVAVVLLLPKPSLDAHPALDAEKVEADRVAALEDALYAQPDSVDRAVELGDAYLRLLHPDWTLGTLARFRTPALADHRVYLLTATAYAERLDAQACVDEVTAGLALCDREGATRCPERVRTRFEVVSGGMRALLAAGVDARKDPKRAKEIVAGVLHAAKPRVKTTP